MTKKDGLMKLFSGLHRMADNLADKISDFVVKDAYEEAFTLEACIDIVKSERKKNPVIKNFILSVKPTGQPRDEYDNFTVTVAFLDAQRQPVSYDGKTTAAYVFHTKAVDEKIMSLLKGSDSVTVSLGGSV